jgi:hypothetical protein
MSELNVDNLNPGTGDFITIGPNASATEGARFGILPAPSGATLDESSLVFGHDALTSASTGRSNIAIGSESQKNTTDGRYNISVGNSALENCNSGEGNIAIGDGAMKGAVSPLEGNDQNVAIGFNSLKSIDAYGASNVAIGSESGSSITAGTTNVCIGVKSGRQLTTGDRNILIGNYAGSNGDVPVNGIQTGSDNIVLQTGSGTDASAIDSSKNVIIGSSVSGLNSTGDVSLGSNVVIGHDAGSEASGVGRVVMIGADAGKNAVQAVDGVCIGPLAGKDATFLGSSIAIGTNAGLVIDSPDVVGIGDRSLQFATGSKVTALGSRAGSRLTTGSFNLLLGTFAGSAGDSDTGALLTGSNNIVLAAGDLDWQDIMFDVSNTVVIGSSTQTQIYAGVNTITALSDKRDKKDVKEISAGLEFVKELKPVDFIWDERKETGKRGIKDCGFLAQDLKETEDKYGVADYLKLVDDKNPEKLLATYGRLLPVMVKAIQELSAELEILKNK